MPALTVTSLTLADWAKRLDPEGKVGDIVELLSQTNEILTDMVFVEGNLPTGHRIVIRTGLPAVYYRAINQGVPASKSETTQVDESCGMLEARSQIDVELLNLNGNSAEFMMSEDAAFIESMNQTMAGAVFYGNPAADPRQFLGVQTRYSAISGAANGANVLSAGGSTASQQMSVYLMAWGSQTCFGIFPKGSQAGLKHQDLGEDDVPDANGNLFRARKGLYGWKNGLVVKDWRYIVRICNIDRVDLLAQTGTQAPTAATNIINMMSRAIDRLPSMGLGRPVFYCNRTVMSLLRIAALNRSNAALGIQDALTQFGKPFKELTFLGIPIRCVDQLATTEGVVS